MSGQVPPPGYEDAAGNASPQPQTLPQSPQDDRPIVELTEMTARWTHRDSGHTLTPAPHSVVPVPPSIPIPAYQMASAAHSMNLPSISQPLQQHFDPSAQTYVQYDSIPVTSHGFRVPPHRYTYNYYNYQAHGGYPHNYVGYANHTPQHQGNYHEYQRGVHYQHRYSSQYNTAAAGRRRRRPITAQDRYYPGQQYPPPQPQPESNNPSPPAPLHPSPPKNPQQRSGTSSASSPASSNGSPPGRECKFCKNNGESSQTFRSHILRNPATGQLICPILRSHVCENCGGTGDEAHTRNYCPKRQTKLREALPVHLKRTRRQSDGHFRS